MNNIDNTWGERFDEQFGSLSGDTKELDEQLYDLVGRTPGCDGCLENVELREEHKQFIKDLLQQERSNMVAMIEGVKQGLIRSDLPYYKGAHEALEDIINNINKSVI